MANDRPMLSATDIVKNPRKISEYDAKYVIICDWGEEWKLDNLNRALCIMAENGWKPIGITSHYSTTLRGLNNVVYVLMERIR